jgi:hypothetical protein
MNFNFRWRFTQMTTTRSRWKWMKIMEQMVQASRVTRGMGHSTHNKVGGSQQINNLDSRAMSRAQPLGLMRRKSCRLTTFNC